MASSEELERKIRESCKEAAAAHEAEKRARLRKSPPRGFQITVGGRNRK